MLCAMYLAQGIPWGFMTIALIAYLASLDVSTTEAGGLVAVVLLPWTFKLIWAPLVDSITIRSMGRRRPWIIGSELMMAMSLLGLLALGDLSQNLKLLAWMFFIHNCFASIQDVSTDTLAVDVLPPAEQGRVNGLMWGSKLIGKAIGASAMAIAISQWGIQAAVWLQFFMLLVIMLFPLLLVERPGDRRLPWTKPVWGKRSNEDDYQATGDDHSDRSSATMTVITSSPSTTDTESRILNLRSPKAVIKDLVRALSLVTTCIFLVYGLIHVIGWGIVEVVTKVLYVQELGWTFVEVSNVSGGMALIIELIGALVGGILADRLGRRFVMALGFGGYGLLAILFGAFPDLWTERWFATAYLLLNPGLLAFGVVGFISMAMRVSWTGSLASMFTIYMTVSNISHVIGNKSVGPLLDKWGFSYEEVFWTAGMTMLLPLLLLVFVQPKQVDEKKNEELNSG